MGPALSKPYSLDGELAEGGRAADVWLCIGNGTFWSCRAFASETEHSAVATELAIGNGTFWRRRACPPDTERSGVACCPTAATAAASTVVDQAISLLIVVGSRVVVAATVHDGVLVLATCDDCRREGSLPTMEQAGAADG